MAANTKPAAVTTAPEPAIARMMPVFKPAPISSWEPRDQQQVVVRPHGQQQNDGQRQHYREQLDTKKVLPNQHGKPEEAPIDSATVPTMTSAATRLRVMNIMTRRIRLSARRSRRS